MGSPGAKVSMRVMHMSRGLPLISALHEPHLPALQFQRHGEVAGLGGLDAVDDVEHDHALLRLGTWYSSKSPPLASPRQTRIVTSVAAITFSPRGAP